MRHRVSLFLLLLILCGTKLLAQCVFDEFEVDKIDGYVVSSWRSGEYSIPNTSTVELRTPGYPSKVILSSHTDRGGYFEMKNVKPGYYLLRSISEGLIPAGVHITVRKRNKLSENRQILVILSADGASECGGDSVKLESKEEIRKVLSLAN